MAALSFGATSGSAVAPRGCTELGLEPATIKYDGDTPAAYVLSQNLQRGPLDGRGER